MAFSDHFVGVAQSRWAGYAILAAIIAVSLAILFGKEEIPLGNRVMVIVVMFLMALPTIVLVLFQINCLVNGTSKAPYCGWYAWLVAAVTILYCILLIIVAVTAKAYEQKAEKFTVSFEEANRIAGGLMSAMEGFEDVATPEEEEKVATVEKKKKDSAPAEGFKNAPKQAQAQAQGFQDGPKKPAKEGFADYSYGAAPVDGSANMYML